MDPVVLDFLKVLLANKSAPQDTPVKKVVKKIVVKKPVAKKTSEKKQVKHVQKPETVAEKPKKKKSKPFECGSSEQVKSKKEDVFKKIDQKLKLKMPKKKPVVVEPKPTEEEVDNWFNEEE